MTRGEYRLAKFRDGRSWYARISVVAEAAASAFAIVEAAVPPYFRAAIHRGIALAVAEHERRGGRACRSVVERFRCSNVDTNDNVAECVAAIATWNALGYDERTISLGYASRRWYVELVDANRGA